MASSQPSIASKAAERHDLMSSWNESALVSLQVNLKLYVLLESGLGDKLEKAAGGLMDHSEAVLVREQVGNSSQMEMVINILRGKSDEDFEIFCKILRESNNGVWAHALKKEAEKFKIDDGEKIARGLSFMEEMPVDIATLTIEELFQYLSVELDEVVANTFKIEKVSGMEFLELTEEDLKETLDTLGDRKKVMRLQHKHLQAKAKVKATPDGDDKQAEVVLTIAKLAHAVHNGWFSEVRKLIDENEEILQTCAKRNFHLLHLASGTNCLQIIQYLVQKMTAGYLFEVDSIGKTALHCASCHGHFKIVKYFVKSCGFDVKARDKEGMTPFLEAVLHGHCDVAYFLLENGSDILECGDTGLNVLHLSAQGGHLAMAQRFAPKMDGHLLDQTIEGATALHVAAQSGSIDVAKYFVTVCGFDVNAQAKNGNTALLFAAFFSQVDLVCFLVESGGNIFHRGDGGRNAFHASAYSGHCAVVKLLAPKMANHLFDTDDAGFTALHWAAERGHLAVVEYLVRACGFNVKAKSQAYHTPLLMAVCNDKVDVAQFLLENGSDIFEHNEFKMNALHFAAMRGNLELVKHFAPLAGDRICDKSLLFDSNCLDWAMKMDRQSVALYLSSTFPVLRTKSQPKSANVEEIPTLKKACNYSPFYPMTSYKRFSSPGSDYGTKVLAKLTEFNRTLSQPFALSEPEVASLQIIGSELSKPPPSALFTVDHCQLLYTMLNWPSPLLFPVLDLVRLALLQPVGMKFLLKSDISRTLVDKILDLCLDGDQPNNVMVARRCLANMFSSPDGCSLMVVCQQRVFPALVATGESSNRTTQIALATVILNYCHYYYQKGDCGDIHVLLSVMAEILQSVTFDAEAKLRTLVAVGTLVRTGRDMTEQLKSNGLRELIQPLATQKCNEKLSNCAKALLEEV